MRLNANLSLEGEYSVDVFRKNGERKYSIGPKKNFITSTGLSFIGNFAMADCFRYVSFGSSSAVNTLNGNNGWGTSYLSARIPQLSYIGGRDVVSDGGHVRSQYEDAGFTENLSGVRLSRSWRIPSGYNDAGEAAVFDQNYTFQEVMLSPGRGYEVGISQDADVSSNATNLTTTQLTDSGQIWTTNQWIGYMVIITDTQSVIPVQTFRITSNTATQLNFSSSVANTSSGPYSYEIHSIFQLCYCGDEVTDINGDRRKGIDCASIVPYYSGTAHKDICAASGAFARMVQEIDVAQDDYLIFTYNLDVSMETGRYPFRLAVNNNRGPLKNLSLWQGITGVHQLIHHGIKLISNGTVASAAPFGNITQDDSSYWSADYDYGESFSGPWGAPLEPSTLGSRLSAYLTSDNLQFFANSRDGGAFAAGVAGFSGTSGLMAWNKTPYVLPPTERQYNIRRPTLASATPYWPLPSDYTSETATPEDFTHIVKAMVPTFDTSVVYPNVATPSGRTRSVTRSFQFAGRDDTTNFANANDGSPFAVVRGIVLAYQDPSVDTNSLIPYLDCLIMDSGRAGKYRLLPQKDAPSVGKYSTGIIPTSASYWPYLEGDAKLTFTFTETWGSPCSPTVQGCPGYVP